MQKYIDSVTAMFVKGESFNDELVSQAVNDYRYFSVAQLGEVLDGIGKCYPSDDTWVINRPEVLCRVFFDLLSQAKSSGVTLLVEYILAGEDKERIMDCISKKFDSSDEVWSMFWQEVKMIVVTLPNDFTPKYTILEEMTRIDLTADEDQYDGEFKPPQKKSKKNESDGEDEEEKKEEEEEEEEEG